MIAKRSVTKENVGARLDFFLSKEFELLSKRKAKSLCDEGKVRVNGRRSKSGSLLREDDTIELEEALVQVRARPELVDGQGPALEVLYEDDFFLAVNKPPQMSSVVLRGDDPLTLADHLAAISPETLSASSDPRESGLVQRLDFSTSGVIFAAKTREIWEKLHFMLLSGDVAKEYIALVENKLSSDELTVNAPLRSVDGGERMLTVADGDTEDENLLDANSLIRRYAHEGKAPLVLVRGNGMRRHQVRTHLAHVASPLVGDSLYGAKRQLSEFGIKRDGFLLHASSIRFEHPVTHKTIEVTAQSAELDQLQSAD